MVSMKSLKRLGEKVIGFASNEADKYDEEALLEQIRPEDLNHMA